MSSSTGGIRDSTRAAPAAGRHRPRGRPQGRGAVSPEFLAPLSEVTCDKGESVTLRCKVCGRPKATVTWMGPDQTILNNNGHHIIAYRGRFSVVKRCEHKLTKCTVAVKLVNKKLMKRDQVTQELSLLQRLQHTHLVTLLDTYETPSSYALVMEMVDQGRLLDYIVSWGNLTEEKVASYLRNILEALHYLHNS
eukprot:XP_013998124.1 PREDICTED: triple functional domain protein-like [Salmo salar]